MGMPIITPGNTTADQAITNLIESIAMQGLFRIIPQYGQQL